MKFLKQYLLVFMCCMSLLAHADRYKGIFNFSGNYEPLYASSLDARAIVPYLSDLTKTNTFGYFAYKGMIVSVYNDPITNNNGLYILKNLPYTNSANWAMFATGINDITNSIYNSISNSITTATNTLWIATTNLNTGTAVGLTNYINSTANTITNKINSSTNTLWIATTNLNTGTAVGLTNYVNSVSNALNNKLTISAVSSTNYSDAISNALNSKIISSSISSTNYVNGIAQGLTNYVNGISNALNNSIVNSATSSTNYVNGISNTLNNKLTISAVSSTNYSDAISNALNSKIISSSISSTNYVNGISNALNNSIVNSATSSTNYVNGIAQGLTNYVNGISNILNITKISTNDLHYLNSITNYQANVTLNGLTTFNGTTVVNGVTYMNGDAWVSGYLYVSNVIVTNFIQVFSNITASGNIYIGDTLRVTNDIYATEVYLGPPSTNLPVYSTLTNLLQRPVGSPNFATNAMYATIITGSQSQKLETVYNVSAINTSIYSLTTTVTVADSLDFFIYGLPADNVAVRDLVMFLSNTNEAAISKHARFSIYKSSNRLNSDLVYLDTNQLYWASPSTSVQPAGSISNTVSDATGITLMDRYAVGGNTQWDYLMATGNTATVIYWDSTNKFASAGDANTKISRANYLSPYLYDDLSGERHMWCRMAWTTPYTGTVTIVATLATMYGPGSTNTPVFSPMWSTIEGKPVVWNGTATDDVARASVSALSTTQSQVVASLNTKLATNGNAIALTNFPPNIVQTNQLNTATNNLWIATTNLVTGTSNALNSVISTKVSTNNTIYTTTVAKASTAWQNPANAAYWTWTSDGTQITLTGYTGPNNVTIPDMLDGLPVTGLSPIFIGLDITSVSGGKNITSIPDFTFVSCTNLTSVSLPVATSIGQRAFRLCTALTSINLPAVTNIGDYALASCSALTSINLPAVTNIGDYALASCSALTSISFGQNAPAEATYVYYDTPNITNYVTNPIATGWSNTWGGRPVVRLPVYADEYWRLGTNLTTLLSWKIDTNDTRYLAALTNAPTLQQVVNAGNTSTNLGSLTPAQSNQYDLGSAELPFRDGYFGTNSLYLGDYKISKAKALIWDDGGTNGNNAAVLTNFPANVVQTNQLNTATNDLWVATTNLVTTSITIAGALTNNFADPVIFKNTLSVSNNIYMKGNLVLTNVTTSDIGAITTNQLDSATNNLWIATTNLVSGTSNALNSAISTKVSTNDIIYTTTVTKASTAWQNPANAAYWTWTSNGREITLTGYTGPNDMVIPDMLDGLPVTGLSPSFSVFAITSISGGKNMVSIPDSTFVSRNSLTSVSLPAVTSIGQNAFANCFSLTSVSLPAVTSIGQGAFANCLSLTSVSLPSAISVGVIAFDNCLSLTSVSLPSATSVGDSAFEFCLFLTSVYFAQNALPEASGVYIAAPKVTNYVISSTATGWGTTWNDRPVVRLPVYADEYWRLGTNLTTLLSWKIDTNDTRYLAALTNLPTLQQVVNAGNGATNVGGLSGVGIYNLGGGTDFVSRVTVLDQLVSKQDGGTFIGRDDVSKKRDLFNVGETWIAKDSSRNWRGVSLSSDGKYQTAVAYDGQIYISSDYGNTWTAKASIYSWLGVSLSSDGKYQTAVAYGGQIYISSDYGDTWIAKDSSRDWGSVSLSSDGKYQTAVAVGGQIYISSDYGNTWIAKDSSRNWGSVSLSSDGKYQTAVAVGGQIYISSDYGNTWIAKESSRNWGSVSLSSDGKYQTAVAYGGQIYISSDYGNTWIAKDSSRNWRGVSLSSDGKYQTAVAYGGQIYISSDYGNTWAAKDSNRTWISVSISSDGKYQTSVCNGQIYVSVAGEVITGDLRITNGTVTASSGFVGNGASITNVNAATVGGLTAEQIMKVGVKYYFTTNIITYGVVTGRTVSLVSPTEIQESIYTGGTNGQYLTSYLIKSNDMPEILLKGTYSFEFKGYHKSSNRHPTIGGDLYIVTASSGVVIQEFENTIGTEVKYSADNIPQPFTILINITNDVPKDGYAFLMKTKIINNDGDNNIEYHSFFGKGYWAGFTMPYASGLYLTRSEAGTAAYRNISDFTLQSIVSNGNTAINTGIAIGTTNTSLAKVTIQGEGGQYTNLPLFMINRSTNGTGRIASFRTNGVEVASVDVNGRYIGDGSLLTGINAVTNNGIIINGITLGNGTNITITSGSANAVTNNGAYVMGSPITNGASIDFEVTICTNIPYVPGITTVPSFADTTNIVTAVNNKIFWITNTFMVSNTANVSIPLPYNRVKLDDVRIFISTTNNGSFSKRGQIQLFRHPNRRCDKRVFLYTNALFYATTSTVLQPIGSGSNVVADASGIVPIDLYYQLGANGTNDFISYTNFTSTVLYQGCTNEMVMPVGSLISHVEQIGGFPYYDATGNTNLYMTIPFYTPWTSQVTTVINGAQL